MARERAHATSKRGRDARQGAHEGGRSKTGCGICGGFARGSVTTAGFINEGADSSGQWAAWMSDRRCWGERQDSEWDQCTRPGDPCANVSTLGARPMAQSACGSHVQRANAPGHHCATIPPRTCVTAPPWCAAHAHCTPTAHPATVPAALAVAPQARPPNAHSRPQTNATDKRITQAPQPGACPWPGLPHAGPPPPPRQWSAPPARTCAWTHGSARAAPSRPRAMRTQPPALHRPVQPFIALYRSGRHLRAVGVYTFGLSMGSPGSSTGGASSGGSIGSGFGSWSLLGSLGVVAMGCTSCRRYSATSVVLASAWASKRKG